MFQRINVASARPATTADGAPRAEQLIEAYDVPLHRQGSVRREVARYSRRRDLTHGLLASVRVSASREFGRGLKDRLRRLSVAAGVSGLIDGRRALLAVDESDVPAALAIGAMLMTPTPPHDMEGLGILGHRFLGQHVIDCCIGGSDEADDDRDKAHTDATLMRDGVKCDEERETVTTFKVTCHLAVVTPSTAAAFMIRVAERTEADGAWIDNARTPGTDIVDRIMQQLQLDAVLDQLNAAPVVLVAIEQRRQDRPAWQRAHRAVAPKTSTVPVLPGSFDQNAHSHVRGIYPGKAPYHLDIRQGGQRCWMLGFRAKALPKSPHRPTSPARLRERRRGRRSWVCRTPPWARLRRIGRASLISPRI